LLVEQNVQAALRIADTALVLVAGRRSLLATAVEVRQANLAALFFHGEG
jgi:branched-chain amino acid transport system ATP-binding protein